MAIDPLKLIRPNIAALVPYASARDEYKGKEGVFLDANEHPVDSGLNRYPDPYQHEVKELFGAIRGVDPSKILFGNGSDEVIDLIFRAFCVPGKDNVIVLPPTYGMYKVSAGINDVEVREVLLNEQYQPDVAAILKKADENSKVLFICSPNNPSGNVIFGDRILQLVREFPGIVVVDDFDIKELKTRLMAETLGYWVGQSTALVLMPAKDQNYDNLVRSASNIESAKVLLASYLNVRDVLSFQKVVLPLKSIDALVAHLG